MKFLNNPNLFLKGTCEVTIKRPKDGRIVYQSNLISTNNFQTEVDMGPVRAGLGNSVVIQLPSNSAVNVDITAADFSLQADAMVVGEETAYNAIVPVCRNVSADIASNAPSFTIDPETMELTAVYPDGLNEDAFELNDGNLVMNDPGVFEIEDYYIDDGYLILSANDMKLVVRGANPVIGYGDNEKYCYIRLKDATDLGNAYIIDDDGNILGFKGRIGDSYNVMYFERTASAMQLGISAAILPGIYTVSSKMAVYSNGAENGKQMRGTQVGWASYYIPRMQFNGNVSLNGGQTENTETRISGTALSYFDMDIPACRECQSSILAYMTYEPIGFNSGRDILGLGVIGGMINITRENVMVIPVKYIMKNNTIIQPKLTDLSYQIHDEEIALVTDDGAIIGATNGETTLRISTKDENSGIKPIFVLVRVN